jgi:hypothetical protein
VAPRPAAREQIVSVLKEFGLLKGALV